MELEDISNRSGWVRLPSVARLEVIINLPISWHLRHSNNNALKQPRPPIPLMAFWMWVHTHRSVNPVSMASVCIDGKHESPSWLMWRLSFNRTNRVVDGGPHSDAIAFRHLYKRLMGSVLFASFVCKLYLHSFHILTNPYLDSVFAGHNSPSSCCKPSMLWI